MPKDYIENTQTVIQLLKEYTEREDIELAVTGKAITYFSNLEDL